MIGYVLLIVIAISLSIMVYAYLRGYFWQDTERCDEGIGVIVEDYNCDTLANTLNLTIKNQGTLSVDGFMIYGSNESTRWFPLNQAGKSDTKGEVYFEGNRLNASKSRNFIFSYNKDRSITELEIKPLQVGKKLIVCENAIINQDISGCN